VSQGVDYRPPTVSVDLANGATLRPGHQLIAGTANDNAGLRQVEVRVDNGDWGVAEVVFGGNPTAWRWQIGIDVPDTGQVVIAARATDIYGLVGQPVSTTVYVDGAPPVASIILNRSVLSGTSVVLTGTVTDAESALGLLDRVEVQIDDGAWQVAPPPYLLAPITGQPLGTRLWRYTWQLPREEGGEHRVRVRAVDAAGNVGQPSAPTVVTVDSIAPVSSIVYPQAGATIPETCLNIPQGNILMWGTANDGWGFGATQVSVDGGRTWQVAVLGTAAAQLLAQALCDVGGKTDAQTSSQLWAVILPAPYGEIALRSRAIDRAGNVEALKAPVRVHHMAVEATPTATPSVTATVSPTTPTVTATPSVTTTVTATPTATTVTATPTAITPPVTVTPTATTPVTPTVTPSATVAPGRRLYLPLIIRRADLRP
jgi:hypothetical protein